MFHPARPGPAKRIALIAPETFSPALDAGGCRALESFVLENIPLTRAMALSVHCRGPDRLQLKAPLAANVNDKGTGFGGSQVALATLAAWGQGTSD